MRAQSLSRVTLQTLENYRAAADQAVLAYRSVGHRLVGAVNGALQGSVYPRTAKWAPRATDRINGLRGNVSQIVVSGIDKAVEGAQKAIALSSTTAAAQVSKVADFAGGIDIEWVANSLDAATRLTMPGAKIALAASSKVAEGAQALADAARARPVGNALRKAAADSKRKLAPATRKTQAAAKGAAKRVANAVERQAAVR